MPQLLVTRFAKIAVMSLVLHGCAGSTYSFRNPPHFPNGEIPSKIASLTAAIPCHERLSFSDSGVSDEEGLLLSLRKVENSWIVLTSEDAPHSSTVSAAYLALIRKLDKKQRDICVQIRLESNEPDLRELSAARYLALADIGSIVTSVNRGMFALVSAAKLPEMFGEQRALKIIPLLESTLSQKYTGPSSPVPN
jgi:hypothetical protein